jgi:hypothetical protein
MTIPEGEITSDLNLTAKQIIETVLAIPAFLPVGVSTGYVAAFATNLCNFRQRSLVERIFWSIPLSLAVSTISAVLIGKFTSLGTFVAILWATIVFCAALLVREKLQCRRLAEKWNIGWKPFGGAALTFASLWIVVVILLLVDWQRDHQLNMSLVIFDHGMRVAWTQSVLRTGIPPTNPLYMYLRPAPMRYYYFWYVICAAVAKMAHLPARAVFNASCVWSGFSLASLIGLYLKHFLSTGSRLRRQFLSAIALLTVTGLGACVNLWNFLHAHIPLPGYLEVWRAGQIASWLDSLLWDPHHVASLVCCMFGFLLAWNVEQCTLREKVYRTLFIAAAFASAFGLSIYVAFAFFLVMLAWSVWQIAYEHKPGPMLSLTSGGIGSLILLIPYLRELTHGSSNVQGGGASVFSFAIREMIPPDDLLSSGLFQNVASNHPFLARNLANAALLVPGYAAELGFFFVIFLIYLIPPLRGRTALSATRRSLIVISVATLVCVTFIRSSVLESNDFGWRGALLLQFALLLLASEVVTSWGLADRKQAAAGSLDGLPKVTPQFVRAAASLALILGVFTTAYQALMIRFMIPVYEMRLRAKHDPRGGQLAHKAYISAVGYDKLNTVIAPDSVVQYNPWSPDPFWTSMDWADSAHQSAIAFDSAACGAELGGDPSGCGPMASAIHSLYNGVSAEQAHAICAKYGIQYLVARIYDPVWNDKNSWVWSLKPVAIAESFRALTCK